MIMKYCLIFDRVCVNLNKVDSIETALFKSGRNSYSWVLFAD